MNPDGKYSYLKKKVSFESQKKEEKIFKLNIRWAFMLDKLI